MTLDAQKVYQQMYDCYRSERVKYLELQQLSQRQFDLLSQGNQEEAIAVVGRKGRLIAEIGEIEGRLEPLKEQWNEKRALLSTESEQPLADLVEELKGLIQSILDQDAESEVLLKELAKETSQRMHQLRQGQQAAQAYQSQKRQGGSPDPCLIDRKE